MIQYLLSICIVLVFTLLAFRKNAVAMLSISFTLIYIIEVVLFYISPAMAWNFIYTFGAKYPPDIGIFTAIYVHSLSPGHVFFNILFFLLAGLPFEHEIHSKWFTTIFLVSGISANIGYSLFLHFYGINSLLIGASGAIFGIMGAFIIMYPNKEITMFLGPILMPRIKVKYAILALLMIEFVMTMLWVNDSVAHGAHVIGAVTGALMGYALRGHIHATGRAGKIYDKTFTSLTNSRELIDLYKKIKAEDDPLIQRLWIEEFFTRKFKKITVKGKYVFVNGKKYRIYW